MVNSQGSESSLSSSIDIMKYNPKYSRRRSILLEFSQNTSVHAIPGIARSQSCPNRCFWICSFVTFVTIMIFVIIQSIRAYFAYPTQTSVTIMDLWPQYYPAFTFCNLSPIRYDRFLESFSECQVANFSINTTDQDLFVRERIICIVQFFQEKIDKNESLSSYFFPLSSMLMKCTFNGQECSSKDFIPFTSSTYGFCYMFNAKMKNVPNGGIRYSHENGGDGKLSLQLYVHSHQYIPYLTESTGIIAMVHDNTELPCIHISGMELAPGFRHRLTYRRRMDIFQPSPYSNCTTDIPLSLQAMFYHYQDADFAYTEGICLTTCTQAHNYARCGCIDPSQWDARFVVLPNTNKIVIAPLCNVTDPCYRDATRLLMNDRRVMKEYCSMCTPHCINTNFIVKSSLSKTPQKWLMNSIKRFVEDNSSIPLPSNWSTDWQQHIYESFLSVEVIRETTSIERYIQTPTLDLFQLIANIGGHTGLWLGLSFLSLMEIVEMLYRLVRHECYLIQNMSPFLNQRKITET